MFVFNLNMGLGPPRTDRLREIKTITWTGHQQDTQYPGEEQFPVSPLAKGREVQVYLNLTYVSQ